MKEQMLVWLASVDALLSEQFCVDLDDVGWNERDHQKYFEYGLEPMEFVQWYGEKYDLTARFWTSKLKVEQ